MFQTFDSAKLPIFWKDVGESVWSYAELMVNATWFYADCKVTDGVDTVTSTYLLSASSQIGDLIKHPEISIRSLYIVSPPYINGTDSWKMSPLAKISAGKIRYEGCEGDIEIYELGNGEKLYSSCEINNDEQIENIKILYS
ncbi:MAG: hypothetical protein CTY35_03865 [Methylotenera sp.]|nr:MAG: hypothetical protein CTY35_03865 [Methylotenera sp.]